MKGGQWFNLNHSQEGIVASVSQPRRLCISVFSRTEMREWKGEGKGQREREKISQKATEAQEMKKEEMSSENISGEKQRRNNEYSALEDTLGQEGRKITCGKKHFWLS